MLKKIVVQTLTKRRIKNRSTADPRSYTESKSIGVIVNARSGDTSKLEEFVKSFRQEGKKVMVLTVDTRRKKKGDEKLVTKSDISIWGKIKSDLLERFLKTKFDFLLVLDQEMDFIIQYIAASSRASYIIGFNDIPGREILDLQIKAEKNRELDDMLKYTKMINHA